MQFKVFYRRNALIRFHVVSCAELQSSYLKVNGKKKRNEKETRFNCALASEDDYCEQRTVVI